VAVAAQVIGFSRQEFLVGCGMRQMAVGAVVSGGEVPGLGLCRCDYFTVTLCAQRNSTAEQEFALVTHVGVVAGEATGATSVPFDRSVNANFETFGYVSMAGFA
jgi:hypothetical protein